MLCAVVAAAIVSSVDIASCPVSDMTVLAITNIPIDHDSINTNAIDRRKNKGRLERSLFPVAQKLLHCPAHAQASDSAPSDDSRFPKDRVATSNTGGSLVRRLGMCQAAIDELRAKVPPGSGRVFETRRLASRSIDV